jgi:hypothetical protein
MLSRFRVVMVGLLGAALVLPVGASAQDSAPLAWPDPVPNRQPVAEADKRPAPQRDLTGMWGSRLGNQAKGVQLRPNDGSPIDPLPFTPYGLERYESYRPAEGVPPRAVPPAETNDPRTRCEPLGFPRINHYDLGVQIFQDEHKVAILYNYDNPWRIIWTDGRSLPTPVEGGVEMDGQYRSSRWVGYSVGTWLDDYTLEVQTVGTMPEDRVWLDNTGRPISDQVRVTETFRRLDYDTLEWSETIDDPKMYTRPWQTMQIPMVLQDGRTDAITRYCSPTEIEEYNRIYGDAASVR